MQNAHWKVNKESHLLRSNNSPAVRTLRVGGQPVASLVLDQECDLWNVAIATRTATERRLGVHGIATTGVAVQTTLAEGLCYAPLAGIQARIAAKMGVGNASLQRLLGFGLDEIRPVVAVVS